MHAAVVLRCKSIMKNVMLNARAVVLPRVSMERNNTSEWNKPHQHYWRLLFLNLWSEDLNISMDQNSE